MSKNKKIVNIIGGGLAGVEAATYLARHGVFVRLFEQKPLFRSPAHHSDDFAELVCSNSLKSSLLSNACGLLKEEIRLLGSVIIEAGNESKVPAGQALAVDRDIFSKRITEKIRKTPNIEIINKKVDDFDFDENITIVATGPLTDGELYLNVSKICPNGLSFFDAAAPIVSYESIDLSRAYFKDRYDKGDGDYLNCPMREEEYNEFYTELINADRVILKDFEKKDVFESCMPIEIMAKRGKDTLRFGPLKPVGLNDPITNERYYAVLQLRKENSEASLFNLVGFQTNLTFKEQKRVFSLIPALKNAEFVRYGVMHRNTFINAPMDLEFGTRAKKNNKVYFAGQITGVEGYVESAMSGIYSAIQVLRQLEEKEPFVFPDETMIGSLIKYLTIENKNFQPMNANFGIIPSLLRNIRDKKEKYTEYSIRALSFMQNVLKELNYI